MCLVTTPPRRVVVRERDDYAPRPVSNYHGGPRPSRDSVRYVRRTSSVPRDRVGYRSSYRSSAPRVSDDYYARTSRTNITRSQSTRSTRSRRSDSDLKPPSRHHFSMATLRGLQQPELAKRLFKLIKTENHQIGAYEVAARESHSVAGQLSDWGESTGDDAVSDISDKLGVLLAEMAEQEDLFAQNLEDSRSVLKQIRNTERSVQPTRDRKAKIQDEIQKLQVKEPESTKLATLGQELVRAEAQSLVADAQLTNLTRQKFKEAYDRHTAAIIERAEKQILLAQHSRRLLNMLDNTPVAPGEERPAYNMAEPARNVLNDAEASLRNWAPSLEPIENSGGPLGANAMPTEVEQSTAEEQALPIAEKKVQSGSSEQAASLQDSTQAQPPYPTSEKGSPSAA